MPGFHSSVAKSPQAFCIRRLWLSRKQNLKFIAPSTNLDFAKNLLSLSLSLDIFLKIRLKLSHFVLLLSQPSCCGNSLNLPDTYIIKKKKLTEKEQYPKDNLRYIKKKKKKLIRQEQSPRTIFHTSRRRRTS
jgi:hypothetical protein